jgi:hypothetical protein
MGMTERIKTLLFNPKAAWEEISQEEISNSKIMWCYFFPLLLIPVIATFVSYGIIGYRVAFFGSVHSVELGIRSAVSILLSSLAGTLISAFIIDALVPSFGSEKNFNKALQLIIYSYTPGLIGGIFYFYYATSLLGLILGLYGLYLLFLGLKPMMKIADDKQASYFIVSLMVTIMVFSVLTFGMNELLTSNSSFSI